MRVKYEVSDRLGVVTSRGRHDRITFLIDIALGMGKVTESAGRGAGEREYVTL